MRAHWSHRLAFVLAASGSAIGLGNIWKFPYMTGEYGGGAFVLVYLICILAVGLPIFIAELYIGQQGQTNTVSAFEVNHKPKTPWRIPGWLGLVSAFLILSFYSVVGGWVLDYAVQSLLGKFQSSTPEAIGEIFGGLLGNGPRQLLFHTAFMFLTVWIVAKGVRDGLERWTKILMPALMVLLLMLFVHSIFLEGFGQALAFLFKPNIDQLFSKPDAILSAVGHSFFTLSLGMGTMITYGGYLSQKENLVKSAGMAALLDTVIALIAGIIIFSIVFSHGMEPEGGPGLIFITLPKLLSQMPGSYFISSAFFILVSFAALTSAVSILEVVVAYTNDAFKWSRKKSTLVSGISIYILGFLSVFSYNILSDVKIMDLNFLDVFDKLTTNIFLPVGGLLISLFFGWVIGPKCLKHVIGDENSLLAKGLLFTVRVISPIAIFFLLLSPLLL